MKLYVIASWISLVTCAVVRINDKNFDAIVTNSDKWSLVDYYADWCRHCKQLEPIYDKLGELFADEDRVQILRINGDEDGRKTVKRFKIEGFPMIQMFHGSSDPIEYEGARDLEALANFVQLVADVRLPQRDKLLLAVVHLNDLNFLSEVVQSPRKSVVVFTDLSDSSANSRLNLEKLANRIYINDNTTVQIAEVRGDDEAAHKLMTYYDIKEFPTLLIFAPGNQGAPSHRAVGGQLLESLVELINTHCGLHRDATLAQLNSSAGRIPYLDTLLQQSGKTVNDSIELLSHIDKIAQAQASNTGEEVQILPQDDLLMLPYYRKLINRRINGQDGFFRTEYDRLARILSTSSRNLRERTVDSMQKRMNVLRAFLEAI
jgi:protein disulfide-isomerase A6